LHLWVHSIITFRCTRNCSQTLPAACPDILYVDLVTIYISKMYFSQWKPPEVSERMWSENLDASIPESTRT